MTSAPSDAGVEHVGGVTDMIERIARRLCSVLVPEASQAVIDEAWPDYVFAARATIEAMRECDIVIRKNGNVVHELRGSPSDIWRTLCDAALRDGEG